VTQEIENVKNIRCLFACILMKPNVFFERNCSLVAMPYIVSSI